MKKLVKKECMINETLDENESKAGEKNIFLVGPSSEDTFLLEYIENEVLIFFI